MFLLFLCADNLNKYWERDSYTAVDYEVYTRILAIFFSVNTKEDNAEVTSKISEYYTELFSKSTQFLANLTSNTELREILVKAFVKVWSFNKYAKLSCQLQNVLNIMISTQSVVVYTILDQILRQLINQASSVDNDVLTNIIQCLYVKISDLLELKKQAHFSGDFKLLLLELNSKLTANINEIRSNLILSDFRKLSCEILQNPDSTVDDICSSLMLLPYLVVGITSTSPCVLRDSSSHYDKVSYDCYNLLLNLFMELHEIACI